MKCGYFLVKYPRKLITRAISSGIVAIKRTIVPTEKSSMKEPSMNGKTEITLIIKEVILIMYNFSYVNYPVCKSDKVDNTDFKKN